MACTDAVHFDTSFLKVDLGDLFGVNAETGNEVVGVLEPCSERDEAEEQVGIESGLEARVHSAGANIEVALPERGRLLKIRTAILVARFPERGLSLLGKNPTVLIHPVHVSVDNVGRLPASKSIRHCGESSGLIQIIGIEPR